MLRTRGTQTFSVVCGKNCAEIFTGLKFMKEIFSKFSHFFERKIFQNHNYRNYRNYRINKVKPSSE
jgi:hypothetical protein